MPSRSRRTASATSFTTRIADGHALRHFYVAPAQGGVLFEIVDREPGYAGYGAGNALVRMAALESA